MNEQREQLWAKWLDLISEQQQSGKSIAGFCRERGLRVWQFYEWKKRLREGEASQFFEVKVGLDAGSGRPAAARGQAIEIRLKRSPLSWWGLDSMRSICGRYWLCWRAKHDRAAELTASAHLAGQRSDGYALRF
jgi:hypothetical protein